MMHTRSDGLDRIPRRFDQMHACLDKVSVNNVFPRSDTHLDMGEIHATEKVGSTFFLAKSFHIVTLHPALTDYY